MTENRRDKNKLAASLPKHAQGYDAETYQRLMRFRTDYPEWSEKVERCLYKFIAPNAIKPFDKPFAKGRYVYATDTTCAIRVSAGVVPKTNVRRLRSLHATLSNGLQPTPDMQSIWFKPTAPLSTRFRSKAISVMALKSALLVIPHSPIYAKCIACNGSGYVKCPCCNNFGNCIACLGSGKSTIKIAEAPDLQSKIKITITTNEPTQAIELDMWAYHADIIINALEALGSNSFTIHTITPITYRVSPIVKDFPDKKALPKMLFYTQPKSHALGFGLPNT